MGKVKLYIILGLIVFVGLLTVTACSTETIDYDGGTYTGQIKDGVPNGRGTYTSWDGYTKVGKWKDGKLHGQGTFKKPDGSSIYAGEWKDGEWHGQGTWILDIAAKDVPVGSKYVGKWKDSLPHGQGVFTLADGTIWGEGEWQHGWFLYDYNGQFENGLFSGDGVGRLIGGVLYTGEWKDGKPHGQGTAVRHDNTIEDGRWDNGRYVGP